MKPKNPELWEIVVQNAEIQPLEENFHPVRLTTNRGYVDCRYYQVEGAQQGAIWVGGTGGGWDTPARGLYPLLCEELKSEKIASLRVRYRFPTQLEDCVLDVLAGVSFLLDQGVTSIALVGHSLGGAVVIRAGTRAQAVRTVVALATQFHGTEPAPLLATRCSLLLLHGEADPVLSSACSQQVYDLALEPKHLVIYPKARHGLDEVALEVHSTVRDWIINQLNRIFP